MKSATLAGKKVLILGFGQEGLSALRFLRRSVPDCRIAIADQRLMGQFAPEMQQALRNDGRLELHLGPGYLQGLAAYDVIIKSPGIPVILPEYLDALKAGKIFTSPTAIFFEEFPGMVIGITGTKGKSTTASLIHAVLRTTYRDVHLVGNIGVPALDLLPSSGSDTVAVYELSSHQLEPLRRSPHIAVLLNIVPEHLDYYASFDQYVEAKANITRYQSEEDFLVYDADGELPPRIALRSSARKIMCSLVPRRQLSRSGCFVYEDWIAYGTEWTEPAVVMETAAVPLLGAFNLRNVLAAVAVGKLLAVTNDDIAAAVRSFRPLEHRLEEVGTFDGVTYYNDSIATVPEATIAALQALGPRVETLLLGGADRHLNFDSLAQALRESNVRTVILFPPTGERIGEAIKKAGAQARLFPVQSMEEAVALARRHTSRGKICLLSPASPSFGLFRDYKDRGEQFKRLVQS